MINISFIKRTSVFALVLSLMPIISFAADEHHGPSVSGFLWRVFVFAVFAVILYKLLNEKVRNGLKSGVETVKKAIADAEKANTDAKNELADYTRKIAEMNMELERMKIAAHKTAEKEAEMMIAEAERTAARLREMAKRTINAEYEKAMADLSRDQFLNAIAAAEALIAADTDVAKKQKYIQENISKIGA